MIKNILILILLLCISNVNCEITITSLLKSVAYGLADTISIGGNGFAVGESTLITIGGEKCVFAKCLETTKCTCDMDVQLPNATDTYDITITQNSLSATAKLFKYAPPTVTSFSLYENSIVFKISNGPFNYSSYNIQISDVIGINNVDIDKGKSKISSFYFTVPQYIVGGEITITLIDPNGFTHTPIKQTITSTITSMTPNVFDLSGTLVTVTGTHLGKTAKIIIGSNEIPITVTSNDTQCSFTFKSTTRYESPLSITIKNAANETFTSDSTGKPFTFTYTPPVISTFAQSQDKIRITTSNTGTDKSQMKLTINNVPTTITSFIGGMIIADIPHALPEGVTIFSITPGTYLANETKLLIAPIVNGVTKPSWLGGSLTITGMFLKHSHVYIGESKNSKMEISCTANSNGESIVCPVAAGNGTIPLIIINYKDSSNLTSDFLLVVIPGKYQTPPTSAPETPSPSGPSDTPFPEFESEDHHSSSSVKLIVNFLYLSFVPFILLI